MVYDNRLEGSVMAISNTCVCSKIDYKSLRRRSIIRRLWESYAVDLITILQAATDGKCNQQVASESMAELIPKIKMLRDGGRFEKILRKAEMIMVDKVFNDYSDSVNEEPNQVDLRDI